MVSDELVESFSDCIGHAEGFYAETRGGKPDLPQRCHNPGNLTDAGDVGFGTARSVGIGAADITIYRTDEDGWTALRKKVRHAFNGASKVYHLEMTIGNMGLVWSKDPSWGINVAACKGVDPSTTLLELVQADMKMQNRWSANGTEP
jgi:hypothetical protein